MRKLATNLSTGNSAGWQSNGFETICIEGTFDDATATVTASPDGGTTWVPVAEDLSFESGSWASFSLPVGTLFRIELTNDGDATAINVWVA